MNHVIDYLKLDAWLERDEGGSIPIDALRDRGFEIVEPSRLDEATLKTKLWELIEALASIGLYLWGTDHLSDRELYDRIISEILPTETLLIPEDPYMAETCDMVGNGTDESARIFLTYYADEEECQDWLARFGDRLPPRRPKPFDRDRFLPSIEQKAGLAEEDACHGMLAYHATDNRQTARRPGRETSTRGLAPRNNDCGDHSRSDRSASGRW